MSFNNQNRYEAVILSEAKNAMTGFDRRNSSLHPRTRSYIYDIHW